MLGSCGLRRALLGLAAFGALFSRFVDRGPKGRGPLLVSFAPATGCVAGV